MPSAIEFVGLAFVATFFAALILGELSDSGGLLPITLAAMTIGAAFVLGIVRWINRPRTPPGTH